MMLLKDRANILKNVTELFLAISVCLRHKVRNKFLHLIREACIVREPIETYRTIFSRFKETRQEITE